MKQHHGAGMIRKGRSCGSGYSEEPDITGYEEIIRELQPEIFAVNRHNNIVLDNSCG